MKRAEKKRGGQLQPGDPFVPHNGLVAPSVTPLELLREHQGQLAERRQKEAAFILEGGPHYDEFQKLLNEHDRDTKDAERLVELTAQSRQRNKEFNQRLDEEYPLTVESELRQRMGAAVGHAAEMNVLPRGSTLESHVQSLHQEQALAFKANEKAEMEYRKANNAYLKERDKGLAPDDPALVALWTKRSELLVGWNKATEHFREAVAAKATLKSQLSQAYMDELRKIRSFGGEVTWSDDSDAKAVKNFNQALSYYPTAWIEESNKSTMMRARSTKKRAHYSHSGGKKNTFEVVPTEIHLTFPTPEEKKSYLQRYHDKSNPESEYDIEADKEEEVWIGGMKVTKKTPGGLIIREYEVHYPEFNVNKKTGEYGRHYDDDYYSTKPPGNRWQLDQLENGSRYWRRRKVERRKTGETYHTEILTSPGYMNDSLSTATHELAHRMEVTVPGVVKAESELWNSRQQGEEIAHIGPGYGKDEIGIRDNFVNAYMGKVYPQGRNFELLSMGVEAVFHGHDGGLVGLGNNGKSDVEMRNFILGSLATIGVDNDPSYLTKIQ